MPAPSWTPDKIENLAKDTFSEIKLLVTALWQLLALSINPLPVSGRDDSIKEYEGIITGLAGDIAVNLIALLSGKLTNVHELALAISKLQLPAFAQGAAADWHALLIGIIGNFEDTLEAHKQSDPAKAKVITEAALTNAAFLGLGSRVVTVIFELLLPKSMNSFNWLGPILSQFSGFDDILHTTRNANLDAAIGNLARYDAGTKFRTEAPQARDADFLHARRLISDHQLRKVYAWRNMMKEFEDASAEGAFRELSPRIIATMFDDTDFDTSAARPTLEFMGYRDADIDLTLKALEHASLKSIRAEVKTAAEALFIDGMYDEGTLDEALASIGMRDEARRLVIEAATMKRLAKLGADLVAAAKSEYESGEGTVEGYRAALAGAGYVPPLLDALVGTEQAKVEGAVFKKENAALQAEIRKAQTVSIDALREAYHNREISIEAFTAGLLAIGVPPGTAAAFVALEAARPQAKQPAAKKPPVKKKP